MFCGKCGVKNADDAIFCTGCGAKLNGGQVSKNSTSVMLNSNDKNRKVGMIAVAVIAVIVIALVFTLFGGRSYKATVEKFVNAQFDADAEAIFELVPEKMIDYALEEEGYDEDELDEFIEERNEELQDQLDYIERYLGEGWTVSHEILTVEDVTGDDLDDLKDDYEDIDIKVSAAKTVEVELTVKSGETETSNSLDISLIKVGRSWYLDLESMGGIF
ncbi:MAG: zinc-ribbon domain-containing protein [Lachnospiraceae bacterium]|nr:zinc-ribbon domain-containing protein [Lachnospiraceae bacterium]